MKPWRLWAARAVTVLAALGAFEGFAANGTKLESAPILAAYGAVLALLFRKCPSAVAYGMQLGLGTALSCLSLGILFLIAMPAMIVATNLLPMLGKLLFAGLLNLLMVLSGVIGRWRAKDQKAIVQYWVSFLIVLMFASGYTYLSW